MAQALDGTRTSMSTDRARKILLDAFWTPAGWRQNPAVAPEEFDLAKRAGYMFDPSSITHDEANERARDEVRRVTRFELARAFAASLSTRRLEYRSALGSYALGRLLPEHAATAFRPSPYCRICGTLAGEQSVDWNVLNFERHKWGGVRHGLPEYIQFDLRLFGRLEEVVPTETDWSILRAVLRAAASQPHDARPGDLTKALRGLFPANEAERRVVVEILGYTGILSPAARPSPFDVFIAVGERDTPPSAKNDWAYPASWWRGHDGVRADAVSYWFPEIA